MRNNKKLPDCDSEFPIIYFTKEIIVCGYSNKYTFFLKDDYSIISGILDKWNHMTMFSEPWNGNASRFDSNIIHYAGNGIFENKHISRLNQIKEDLNFLYGNNP